LAIEGGIVIKISLKEIVSEGMDWIHSAQDRDRWQSFVNTVMNFRSSNMQDSFTGWRSTVFSRTVLHDVSCLLVGRSVSQPVVQSVSRSASQAASHSLTYVFINHRETTSW